MVLAIAQDVLGRYGDESPQHERPERAALRLDEQGQADAADVGAEQIDNFAAVEPGKHCFCRQADAERDDEPIVAADHVVAQLRCHQHQRDEKCDQIAWVDLPTEIPAAGDEVSFADSLGRFAHRQRSGSVTVRMRSIAGR